VVEVPARLFTLIVAGVFELGRLLPDSLASRQLRHPVMNSALSELLACVVALPKTAPFTVDRGRRPIADVGVDGRLQ